MKNFLAIYVASHNSPARTEWDRLDEATRQKRNAQGLQAWGEWMKKQSAAIVATGGPLGKTKRVDVDGVSDATNTMVGYVVVSAASHQSAAKMFEGHPHFTIFPGEAVEIMECLPIPGQA